MNAKKLFKNLVNLVNLVNANHEFNNALNQKIKELKVQIEEEKKQQY